MPNILEQQDLLKGLPDDRLSTLMQNPTGDIPPFLVAAEAQRRQSIREQFSGGPQESVVDTLTKQMANVPQNIQAPAQQPPQMPQQQMPEMGGVDALQQGMRDGGMVRRFDVGGKVEPLWNFPSYSNAIPRVMDYVGSGLGSLYDFGTTSYSDRPATEEALVDVDRTPSAPFQFEDRLTEGRRAGVLRAPIVQTASPVSEPRDPEAGKDDTSLENQMTAEKYEEYLREINAIGAEDSEYARQKIQELYGDNEASNWERAQKWFAAAQAAIEPGQTNMQAAINALSALGGGYAEERAAEREGQREMAEAMFKFELADRQARTQSERDIAENMLKYRMAEIEAKSAADAARIEQEREAIKYGTGENRQTAEMYLRAAERAEDDLRRYVDGLTKSGMMGPEEAMQTPEAIKLQKRVTDNYILHNDALNAASLGVRRYGESSGVNLDFEEADGVNPIRRPGQ